MQDCDTRKVDMSCERSYGRHIVIFVTVVVVLVAFWLRASHLDTWPPGMSNDESKNVIDAFHISQVWRFPLYEDPMRPEPMFRIILTASSILFGASIWAFRFTSALVGTLTVAAIFWATRECVADLHQQRWIAGLAAAGSLAVSIGHITITRSTYYRALFQPLFMALFIGFLLRGLRTGRRRNYLLAGLSLAAVIHSYFAGLIVPFALIPVGLSLLVFRRSNWQRWLPNLILTGVILGLFASPIAYFLLTDSERLLGHIGDHISDPRDNTISKLQRTWEQFIIVGDVTPMYNTESAPLVPRSFGLLFIVGLLAILVRVREPSSALIAGLLMLTPIPMIASGTIPQNLRSVGLYATYPLVIGLGVASILSLTSSMRRSSHIVGVLLLLMITLEARYAYQTYNNYWDKPYTWRIFDRDLPHGEWFFRTDRRDFARWLAQQDEPLLVPMDELNRNVTRAWLMRDFPHVTTAYEDIVIPPNTRLVVPWNLEVNDLMRDTRHYALLCDGVITLLPPLSLNTHKALLADIDEAPAVYRNEGVLDLLARVVTIPDNMALQFERQTSTTPPLVFDNRVWLLGWSGPDTLEAQTAQYTLYFKTHQPLWHHYSAFVELHTQDFDRKAWHHDDVWHWLFPSTVWGTDDTVTKMFTLTIPPDLQPGAYRLVVGLELTFFDAKIRPVSTADGTQVGNPATVAWIKIPQREIPVPPNDASPVNATLEDAIALRSAYVTPMEDGRIKLSLIWESLVERPDFDATIFVHALQPDGTIVAQDDQRPWGGQYPTFIWGKGEKVRTEHVLDVRGQPEDQLTLTTGMYTFPDLTRLSVEQDGRSTPDRVIRLGQLNTLVIDPNR